MKPLITLILALSLYAPHLAKLLAYADCTVIAAAKGDPLLCDCAKVTDTKSIPDFPAQHDKQKALSLKTDWKYFGEATYKFHAPLENIAHKKLSSSIDFIAEQFPRSVFHPPQVFTWFIGLLV